jgi:hypothetical protein
MPPILSLTSPYPERYNKKVANFEQQLKWFNEKLKKWGRIVKISDVDTIVLPNLEGLTYDFIEAYLKRNQNNRIYVHDNRYVDFVTTIYYDYVGSRLAIDIFNINDLHEPYRSEIMKALGII